ncbi:MAG: AAA family ATPase [Alphaproteobacteria bacterium]|nr:AAA family ATPase [Alphaproteobacteria bacterium]
MSASLGPFELIAPVARGGMGQIWRARAPGGDPVAVKVLTGAGGRDPRRVQSIQTEIRAAAGLSHPSIITLLDAGEVDEAAAEALPDLLPGTPWFAMELTRGGTLRDRLGEVDWVTARRILLDLLDALGHAHARGVVHRDLKPSNVLFVDSGSRLKLADFGMVWALRTADGPLLGGTPAYMAPEQFDGDGRVQGPWTDLYALGLLGWALTTGRRPFDGDDPVALYRAQALEPLPPFEPVYDVPDGLQDWLARALAKQPWERFPRAASAAHGLLALGGGERRIATGVARRKVDPEEQRTTLLHPSGPGTRIFPLHPDDDTPLEDVDRLPPLPREWRNRATPPTAPGGLGLFGLREIPFVGREAERDRLWAALLDAAESRRAEVFVIRGPAGAGKSRLAEWLLTRAHEVGAAEAWIATHHPTPASQDGLDGLMARGFAAHGLDEHELADQIQQRAPRAPAWAREGAVAFCAPHLRRPPRSIPELDARARHAVLGRLLDAAAGPRVSVVWLDDVQWGHAAIRWAHHALANQDVGAALFVLTVQDELLAEREAEDAALDALVMAGAGEVLLGSLDARDTRALARSVLELEGDVVDRLADRTSGNPLFVVQLVEDWVARGRLVRRDGVWALDGPIELPSGVQRVWTDRIDALVAGQPGWEVPLEAAAVLGDPVIGQEWRALLAKVGVPVDEALVGRLLDARLARLDSRRSTGRWRFVHGMLRETLLARAVDSGWAVRLHDAAADVLPHRPELAARRARHLLEAGREDEAIDALRDAANLSKTADIARSRAELLLRESLLERRGESGRRRRDGWFDLARLDRVSGRLDSARSWADRVRDAQPSPEELARLALHYAALERAEGRTEASLASHDRCAALARDLGDTGLEGRALEAKSMALQQAGRFPEALEAIEATLALPDLPNTTRAGALLQRAYLVGVLRSPEEGLELLEAVRDEVFASTRRSLFGNFHNTEGELARASGDLDRAERAYREALAVAEQLGYPIYAFAMNLAMVALARGRAADAEPAFRLVLASDLAGPIRRVYAIAGMMAVAAARRDWREMRVFQRAYPTDVPVFAHDVMISLLEAGRAALEAGEQELARWAIEQALVQAEHDGDVGRIEAIRQLLARTS